MDVDLEKLAEEIVEEANIYNPKSLLPLEQQKEAQKRQVMQVLEMKKVRGRLNRAMALIANEGPQIMSREEAQALRAALDTAATLSHNDIPSNASSPQEALGIDLNVLGLMIRAAKDQYQAQRWENAIDIYTMLTTLNPSIEESWMGLAGALHHLEKWEEACDAYAAAAELIPNKPLALLLHANCALNCDAIDTAARQLKRARQLLDEGDWPEAWQSLANKIEKLTNKARR